MEERGKKRSLAEESAYAEMADANEYPSALYVHPRPRDYVEAKQREEEYLDFCHTHFEAYNKAYKQYHKNISAKFSDCYFDMNMVNAHAFSQENRNYDHLLSPWFIKKDNEIKN